MTMITTLPFMVCLFWTVLFLLEWHRGTHAMHVLTMFMGTCTALYLCHAMFFNDIMCLRGLSNTVYTFCNLAVFPMYYLYICRLTQKKPLSSREWLYLVPAFVMCIWSALHYALNVQNEAMESLRLMVSKVVFVLQLFPVSYFGLKKINDFDRKIEDYYSDPDQRHAVSTRNMVYILLICSLLSFVANYVGREYFFYNNTWLYVPSIMFACSLYALGYVGLTQRFTADDIEDEGVIPESQDEEAEIVEIEDKVEETRSVDQLYKRLCDAMKEEKWYLQNDLRLTDLAVKMRIGRTRLSALINDSGGMSFSDYVNSYRINYAKRLLSEMPSGREIVLSAISEQCGFTSESSFYRAFKKFTGVTPAQYKKRAVDHNV